MAEEDSPAMALFQRGERHDICPQGVALDVLAPFWRAGLVQALNAF
jgi:hypothetical protein